MSRIDEFTSVCAIPVVGAAGKATPTAGGKRRRKRSSVEEFLDAAPRPVVVEGTPPAAVVPPVVASEATPAKAPEAPAAPPAAPAGAAIMISREVAEALISGKSVSVRGVLLEPTFRMASPAAAPAIATEAAAAAFAARVVSESISAEPVNLHAAQPPPAPPSDGRAVAGAFRRFGGAMAT